MLVVSIVDHTYALASSCILLIGLLWVIGLRSNTSASWMLEAIPFHSFFASYELRYCSSRQAADKQHIQHSGHMLRFLSRRMAAGHGCREGRTSGPKRVLFLFGGRVDQRLQDRLGIVLVSCLQFIHPVAELRVLRDYNRLLLALKHLQSSAAIMAKSWQRNER